MTVKNQHNQEAGQQRLGKNPRIVTLISDAGSRKEKDLTALQTTSLKRAKVSTFDVTVAPHHSIHVSSGTGASPRKLTRVTEYISPARFA